jgi:hypothetical protein
MTSDINAAAADAPSARRLSDTEVTFSGADYLESYQRFLMGILMAGIFRDDAPLYR